MIIKIRLNETNNYNYEFKITIEEFVKIVIFTQGYIEDIKNLLDTFIEVQNFSDNIEEYIINVLKEENMKYQIEIKNIQKL